MIRDAKPAAAGLSLPCPPDRIDEFLSEPTPKVMEVLARATGPFLVLGAAGKIGLHLCLMLRRGLDALGRADPVVAVSRFRSVRDRAAFERRGLVVQVADLSHPSELAALSDAPTVFFLAGIKFGTAQAPDLLRQMNVDVPRAVAERYANSRIVALSTTCVYPFLAADSGGASETTPPGPVGEYAQSCLAREEMFRLAARTRGTRAVLVRLSYAVEFRYGVLVDIAQYVRQGQPVDVTTGFVNVIWQGDAVAHIIQSLDLAASPAVPINVTGPDLLSVKSVAERFGELLDRPVRLTGHPAPTALLTNASQSHRLFGAPPTPMSSVIPWTAAWLTQGGATWGKPTGFERRDGRF